MIITHNMGAMSANRHIGMVTKERAENAEKLGTGYRVSRASDDAAGLAISEEMRGQIRGLAMGSKNCQDGISMVQTADGAMAEIHDMLHRCRELCVQAANDTLTSEDRQAIQAEIDQIRAEIDGIADRTEFNTIKVLQGTDVILKDAVYDEVLTGKLVISGANLPSFVKSQELKDGYLSSTLTIGGKARYGATIDFTSFDGSEAKLNKLIGTGINTTCATCNNHYSIRFTNGDPANGEEKSGDHYIYNVNVSGAKSGADITSKIRDVVGTKTQIFYAGFNIKDSHFTEFNYDTPGKLLIYDNRSQGIIRPRSATLGSGYAKMETQKVLVSEEVHGTDNLGLNIQAGANSAQTIKLKMPFVSTEQLAITESKVEPRDAADAAISDFQYAVSYISEERSRMGAYQNRLEFALSNDDNSSENLQYAESRIRDADMAAVSVALAKCNILLEAGQAMLAQANQSTKGVVSLLE